MDINLLLELGAVAASAALFFGAYALMLAITTPRGIDPMPASQELPDEPPAVAGLLATGWQVTEDAAEATLLDLAARGHLELRQPDDDPHHTTIHLTSTGPGGLQAYEKRVYARVKELAMDGVVPLTAMTFRDGKAAKSWWLGFRKEVVADSRARGLSRRRFGPAIVALLVIVAAVAAAGITFGFGHYAMRTPDRRDDDGGTIAAVFFVSFALLATFAGRYNGERDTAQGRVAASRWMGVRDWLRSNEAFGDLPPAAVAVWDRYLAYGAALGATHTSSAVMDLGMGDRTRLWSTFGGTWHRVRVRYPRGTRYGLPAPLLLFRGFVLFFFGSIAFRYTSAVIDAAMTAPSVSSSAFAPYAALTSAAITTAGAALALYGVYGFVRTVIDLASPVRLTGEVLWIEVWRLEQSSSSDGHRRPSLHYLAVDAGDGDRTVAWGLPHHLFDSCRTGDTIELTARRWSRRVVAVNVVHRGTGHNRPPVVATDNMVVAALARPRRRRRLP